MTKPKWVTMIRPAIDHPRIRPLAGNLCGTEHWEDEEEQHSGHGAVTTAGRRTRKVAESSRGKSRAAVLRNAVEPWKNRKVPDILMQWTQGRFLLHLPYCLVSPVGLLLLFPGKQLRVLLKLLVRRGETTIHSGRSWIINLFLRIKHDYISSSVNSLIHHEQGNWSYRI